MSEIVISYNHVNIHQSEGLVLEDVCFDITKGEFLYLIGKTGTGKSSLLKTIYADVPINQGMASVCEYDLTKIKKSEIPYLRRKIGIVFQDFQLLFDRTAEQNLDFVLRSTGWKTSDARKKRIAEVLSEVGLQGSVHKLPHNLSGGEQQRLVIARALLNNPAIFIADEPTGNLDPETSNEIMNLLIRINREHETAIIMATHNYQLIDKYPSRILNCINGGVVEEKGLQVKY